MKDFAAKIDAIVSKHTEGGGGAPPASGQEVIEVPRVTEIPASKEIDLNVPKEEPKVEPKVDDKKEPVTEPKPKDKESNLRALGEALKKERDEKEEIKIELEAYKTGVKIADVLKEKQDRIAELEPYEQVFNFKTSEDYEDVVMAPFQQAEETLKQQFIEGKADVSLIEEALQYTEVTDLNRFLLNNFDQLQAAEIKKTITDYKKHQAKIAELDKHPTKVIKGFQEQAEAIKAQKHAKKMEAVVNVSTKSWVNTLYDLRKDGRFKGLIEVEGDADHNSKIVEPTVRAAGTEYGQLIREVTLNGVTETTGKALSRMVLLAHQAALVQDVCNVQEGKIKELETQLAEYTKYDRPAVKPNSGGVRLVPQGGGQGTKGMSFEDKLNARTKAFVR